jgi:hypothetical protein
VGLDLGEETVTGSVTSGEDEVRGSCWGVWRETGNGEDGGYGLRKVSGVSFPNPLGLVKGGEEIQLTGLCCIVGLGNLVL